MLSSFEIASTELLCQLAEKTYQSLETHKVWNLLIIFWTDQKGLSTIHSFHCCMYHLSCSNTIVFAELSIKLVCDTVRARACSNKVKSTELRLLRSTSFIVNKSCKSFNLPCPSWCFKLFLDTLPHSTTTTTTM